MLEGGDAGIEFLGSQGDVWDAQKDMLADTLGWRELLPRPHKRPLLQMLRLRWIGDAVNTLLPVARDGLAAAGVGADEIESFAPVVAQLAGH